MILPNRRPRMRAVAARLVGDGQQYVLAVFHSCDVLVDDPQLWGIDGVVGGVDGCQRSRDLLELRLGGVVSRGVEVVKHVVGVCSLHALPPSSSQITVSLPPPPL